MSLAYNPDYFFCVEPNIENNEELREPQINAYQEVYDYFNTKGKTSHAIVVLPTGVGKTGLMGILPYGISKGRVLIITPQLVIKDAVLDSLDPEYPGNFWLTRNVFTTTNQLPCLIEYEGNATKHEWLEAANIVVLNIHKLQKRLDSSLLNIVEPDFFDMIIIDEAHHSTADTWVDAVQYFSNAKVIKLTGTPFRTDNEKIVGELVYKYKLSAAMAHGYVKSLENFTYIPDELYLTIDNDESKLYTIQQIKDLGLKDDDWISRSVAYSKECSQKIVTRSIELLEQKLSDNNPVPHKIIAVACSINHAEQIQMLFEEKNYKSAIVHSRLDNSIKNERLKDIENHRVKVVIHVAMLGEGYDHPYLSVAAIFRPFRHVLPYAQFIGRILRTIPAVEAKRPEDNIGQIVSHKHLELEELWGYYKKEIQESETIKYLEEHSEQDMDTGEGASSGLKQDRSTGKAFEVGVGSLLGDSYLDTQLIIERRKQLEEQRKKIEELQKLLNVTEQQAKIILNQAEGANNAIKRPDLYFKRRSKNIDSRIKEEIVPELIQRFGIDKESDDLSNCRLFWNRTYNWIPKKANNNAALLAIYLTQALNNKIGYTKEKWKSTDYEIADDKLDEIREYVTKVLEDLYT